jgi:hypothetical protein
MNYHRELGQSEFYDQFVGHAFVNFNVMLEEAHAKLLKQLHFKHTKG